MTVAGEKIANWIVDAAAVVAGCDIQHFLPACRSLGQAYSPDAGDAALAVGYGDAAATAVDDHCHCARATVFACESAGDGDTEAVDEWNAADGAAAVEPHGPWLGASPWLQLQFPYRFSSVCCRSIQICGAIAQTLAGTWTT